MEYLLWHFTHLRPTEKKKLDSEEACRFNHQVNILDNKDEDHIHDLRGECFTCGCWLPCACSAVGRRSGSTGGFPVQTATGTLSHRGGSGRSAAPGGS